jgi:hypothetical protein
LCFTLHESDLRHECLLGGLSTEGERSSVAKDAPATLNMVVDDVSWELFQKRYLSEEFVERHINEFNAL